MFRWYKNAKVCYAYLSDVSSAIEPNSLYALSDNIGMSLPTELQMELPGNIFNSSRWFKRGWTLQELIAPPTVNFFSRNWTFLGTRALLANLIAKITGIDQGVLLTQSLDSFSVAEKMSWAAHRKTTRPEDRAYCLLGIFDIHMPLLYGEGSRAFLRLQEEIMKVAVDQSLFIWGIPEGAHLLTMEEFLARELAQNKSQIKELPNMPGLTLELHESEKQVPRLHGLLAESPALFAQSRGVIQTSRFADNIQMPPLSYNRGILVELPIFGSFDWNKVPSDQIAFSRYCFGERLIIIAILNCAMKDNRKHRLGIPLIAWSPHHFGRHAEPILVTTWGVQNENHSTPGPTRTLQIRKENYFTQYLSGKFIIDLTNRMGGYSLRDVICATSSVYDMKAKEILTDRENHGIHAALIFGSTDESLSGFVVALGGYIPATASSTWKTALEFVVDPNSIWAESIRIENNTTRINSNMFLDSLFTQPDYRKKKGKRFVSSSMPLNLCDTVNVSLTRVYLSRRQWKATVRIDVQTLNASEFPPGHLA
jgi:hypothetical protein